MNKENIKKAIRLIEAQTGKKVVFANKKRVVENTKRKPARKNLFKWGANTYGS